MMRDLFGEMSSDSKEKSQHIADLEASKKDTEGSILKPSSSKASTSNLSTSKPHVGSKRKFRDSWRFAKDSARLHKFIKGTSSIGFMGFETTSNSVKSFLITWRSIHDDIRGVTAENAESGSLEDSMNIAKKHVQCLLQALDNRLSDLDVFKAMKFFEPVGYRDFAGQRGESTSTWLNTLLRHFATGVVDPLACAEREGFVETLYNACPHKSILGAWKYCTSDIGYSKDGVLHGKWFEDFPLIMRLWQRILVVPISTATSERGFWKQNEVKSKLRRLLHLDTLSMTKIPYEKVDWKKVEQIWKAFKEHERRPW